jgi:hypothetical protein
MNVYFFFGLFGGGSGKSLSCTHPVPLGGFGSERIVHGLLVLGGEFRLLLWGGLRETFERCRMPLEGVEDLLLGF